MNDVKRFAELWDLPCAAGAVDWKHTAIIAPPHAGSDFDYKKFHSIALMAVASSDYTFHLVDVGANSWQSDGGIFSQSVVHSLSDL